MNVKLFIDATEALNKLRAMQDRTADLTPVFQGAIDRFMTDYFVERFATEGSYLGTSWAPLAFATVKARGRRGHGLGGILYDTGRMRGAFVTGAGEGYKIFSPVQYVRGALTPYAAFHQAGTVKMVARPIVELTEGLMTPLQQAIADFVTGTSAWTDGGKL